MDGIIYDKKKYQMKRNIVKYYMNKLKRSK